MTLQFNTTDVPELEVAPAGEYTVRIVKAEQRDRRDKPGSMLALTLTLPGEPNAKPLNHYQMLPDTAEGDKDKENRVLRQLKSIGVCFGIDFNVGVEPDALVGLEGRAILSIEESDEYGPQNRVKRFLG